MHIDTLIFILIISSYFQGFLFYSLSFETIFKFLSQKFVIWYSPAWHELHNRSNCKMIRTLELSVWHENNIEITNTMRMVIRAVVIVVVIVTNGHYIIHPKEWELISMKWKTSTLTSDCHYLLLLLLPI